MTLPEISYHLLSQIQSELNEVKELLTKEKEAHSATKQKLETAQKASNDIAMLCRVH